MSFHTLNNNNSRGTCESRHLKDSQGDLGFQGSPGCTARTCLRRANNNTKPHNTNVLAEDTDYETFSLFSWELPVTCATVIDVKESMRLCSLWLCKVKDRDWLLLEKNKISQKEKYLVSNWP